jgi:hypothetical protein
MVTVLITKQNKDYFLSINPKLKFKDLTKNTCCFKTSKFKQIYDSVKETGNNPFAVMQWF